MNNVEQLIQDHKRLIESEAAKYSGFMPLLAVQAKAYKLARKAAENYNPASGVKFSTYLVNSLQKLYRLSTQYGGSVRVSEAKQFKIQKLNQAEEMLKNELGREPTLQELSDITGFNISTVNNLLKTRKKEVSVNNLAYTPIFIEDDNDEWVNFVYHDLNDRDKFIFEHKTGFGSKPKLPNEDIAKKLNISTSTVANRVKIISDKLAEGWKDGF